MSVMNDLISRKALLKELPYALWGREWDEALAKAIIESMPTIDPVKHGKWIWDDEGYHCSECFYHAYGNTGEVYMGDWHYCPNCGVKMGGGEG